MGGRENTRTSGEIPSPGGCTGGPKWTLQATVTSRRGVGGTVGITQADTPSLWDVTRACWQTLALPIFPPWPVGSVCSCRL